MATDRPTFRGEPRARYGWTTGEGRQRELRANASGLVEPKNDEDVRMLRDAFNLPEARETASETKSSARSRSSKAAPKAEQKAETSSAEEGS